MKKYSKKFDLIWFYLLVNYKIFNFSGSHFDYPSKYQNVLYSNDGVSAKESFFAWESNGEIVPTKQVLLLKAILKAKSSINLNIKMWAEDRASGLLPKIIFKKMIREDNIPNWVVSAVEKQKFKYYEKI